MKERMVAQGGATYDDNTTIWCRSNRPDGWATNNTFQWREYLFCEAYSLAEGVRRARKSK